MSTTKEPRMNNRRSSNEEIPFRRKEDQLKYDVTNKIVGAIKWLVVLNIVIMLIFYNTISNQNTTDTYQLKILNDLNEKVTLIQKKIDSNKTMGTVVSQNDPVPQDVFLPGICNACHHLKENSINIRASWSKDDFKKYVRGEIRIPSNGVMPKFSSSQITDEDLDTIYLQIIKNTK